MKKLLFTILSITFLSFGNVNMSLAVIQTSSLPDGCTSSTLYSPKTGVRCVSTAVTTLASSNYQDSSVSSSSSNTKKAYKLFYGTVVRQSRSSVTRAQALSLCATKVTEYGADISKVKCMWGTEKIYPIQASANSQGVATNSLNTSNTNSVAGSGGTPVVTPLSAAGATGVGSASNLQSNSTVFPVKTSLSVDSVEVENKFTLGFNTVEKATKYYFKIDGGQEISWVTPYWIGTPAVLGLNPGVHTFDSRTCNSSNVCSQYGEPVSLLVKAPSDLTVVASLPTPIVSKNEPFFVIWGGLDSKYQRAGYPEVFIKVDNLELPSFREGFWYQDGGMWDSSEAALGLNPGTHTVAVKRCEVAYCTDWSMPMTLTINNVEQVQNTTQKVDLNLNLISPLDLPVGASANIGFSSSNATNCIGMSSGPVALWNGSVGTRSPSGGKTTQALTIPGKYTQSVTCTAPGLLPVTKSVSFRVIRPSDAVAINAKPRIITPGGSSVITWGATPNQSGCKLSEAKVGSREQDIKDVSSSGSVTKSNIQNSTRYTVYCQGLNGATPAYDDVIVYVVGGETSSNTSSKISLTIEPFNPKTLSSFGDDFSSVIVGETASLNFSSTNATACYGFSTGPEKLWEGDFGATFVANTKTKVLTKSGTYTQSVTCTAPGLSSVTKSQTLYVADVGYLSKQPEVTSEPFSPSVITAGERAVFKFSSINTTSCKGDSAGPVQLWDGDLGMTKSPDGGLVTPILTVPGTYTQRVVCVSPGSTAKGSLFSNLYAEATPRNLVVKPSESAVYTPITLTLNAFSPSTITTGQRSSLSFASTNAVTCTGAAGGPVAWWDGGLWVGDLKGTHTPEGGVQTPVMTVPGTYIQSVTCTAPGFAPVTKTQTLTVTQAENQTPAPTMFIYSGQTLTTLVNNGTVTTTDSIKIHTPALQSNGAQKYYLNAGYQNPTTGSIGWFVKGPFTEDLSGTVSGFGFTPGLYHFKVKTCTSADVCSSFDDSQDVTLTVTASNPAVLGVSTSGVCTNLPINLHRGMEKPSVSRLQSFLLEKGFLEGETTGFYGDKTVEAVKDYQASVGLPVTGMVYDFTRDAIRAESCR